MPFKKHTVRRVGKLLQIFSANSRSLSISESLAYRVPGTPDVSDALEQRIVRLCDGRSVKDLIACVYSEELKQGGWSSDIGMWKGLFDEQVIHTLTRLEQRQIIRIEPEKGQPEIELRG